MARAVLISIRPEWVEKILAKKKGTGSQKEPSQYGNTV